MASTTSIAGIATHTVPSSEPSLASPAPFSASAPRHQQGSSARDRTHTAELPRFGGGLTIANRDRLIPRGFQAARERRMGLDYLARKQPWMWSSTVPIACIAAYIVVGPTNRNPRFFSALLRVSDSGVWAGTSAKVSGA